MLMAMAMAGSGLPCTLVTHPQGLAASKARLLAGDMALKPAFDELRGRAEQALQQVPVSVVDDDVVPPSGDRHDYLSIGPYWWPNPATATGLPYIRKDGQVNPKRDQGDYTALGRMQSAVGALTLAYYLSADERYAAHAAKLLRAWFLDAATRMNPHLNYGQAIPGICTGRGIGIIDTSGLVDLVDRIGLLQPSPHWSSADQAGLVAWFAAYLDWLLTSAHGREEAKGGNNHGSWYDAQVAAFALFAGRADVARRTLAAVGESRIARQIGTDGRQPEELARTNSWSYSWFNLSALTALAALGRHVDVELWHYATPDGRSIRAAVGFLLPYVDAMTPWPHPQIRAANAHEPLRVLLRAGYGYGDDASWAAVRRLPLAQLSGAEELLLQPLPAESVGSGDALARSIEAVVAAAVPPPLALAESAFSVVRFADRRRADTWTEVWPGPDGLDVARPVAGEIWTAAIQAAIDQDHSVFIPARAQPYYLDGPIVLHSGCRLLADPKAEIRLKPGTNTCMVRNAHLVSGHSGPFPAESRPDEDIAVEGGIWTTLRTAPQALNGNPRGRADAQDSIPGAHGMLLFNHVRGLAVRNLTIRQGTPFGLQLAAVSQFLVDGITFEDHHRDGVHLLGLCRDGVVRRIRGVTYDDFVALNAWDWKNYSMVFGPIERILVEDIRGTNQGAASLRLLPGVKTFPDGSTAECPVRDCVFRDLAGLFDVKLYAQPNLELGAANDFSPAVGRLSNLCFQRLTISRAHSPATFQIHADVDGLTLEDVTLALPALTTYRLVSVGPLSMTYKHNPADPATWAEIFAPDRDCTLRNLRLLKVRTRAADGTETPVTDPEALVQIIEQRLNPDYPKTTPRGGTGKGIWQR